MRALAPLAMLAAACGGPPAADLVTIDTLPGGIVRVMNHGPSEWADTNGWHLVLERTIQPGEGEPGELGRPGAMALHPNGDLVVRDDQPTVLRRYWATGDSITLIGREGDGPGEYRDPLPAFVGDSLVTHDQRLARGTIYDENGQPVRSFETVCCSGYFTLPVVADQRIMVRSSYRTPDDPFVQQYVGFTLGGERTDSVPVVDMSRWSWTITKTSPGGGVSRSTWGIPFSGAASPILGRSGDQFFGAGTENRILVSRTGRDTVRIFGRDDVAAVPLPAGFVDSLYESLVDRNADLPGSSSRSDIPDHYPFWSSIEEDGRGNVWLLSDSAYASPRVFDVYRPTGELRGRVTSPSTSRYPRFAWAGDRVAVLDTDADDLPRIRIYRIEREP